MILQEKSFSYTISQTQCYCPKNLQEKEFFPHSFHQNLLFLLIPTI